MKKLINSMLSMLAIAGVLFLSSCGDDEDDPAPQNPTVSLVAQGGFITGDATLTVGDSFSIRVNVIKGDANLASYSITRDEIALASYDGLTIDNADRDGFTANFGPIAVGNNAGVFTYSFVVTDADGNTGSVSWDITVEAAASFTEFTNKQLGGQSNANFGSFFKAADGTVLFLSGANDSDGADVDFFYYNGATNGPTLFSPTDPDAGSLFGGAVGGWSTQRATAIQKSTLTYASATPADVTGATVSGTKANQLVSGDVVIFETVDGLRGIAEVTALATGNNGSITLNVKVVN